MIHKDSLLYKLKVGWVKTSPTLGSWDEKDPGNHMKIKIFKGPDLNPPLAKLLPIISRSPGCILTLYFPHKGVNHQEVVVWWCTIGKKTAESHEGRVLEPLVVKNSPGSSEWPKLGGFYSWPFQGWSNLHDVGDQRGHLEEAGWW